jgi:uncharacterized protein YhfF
VLWAARYGWAMTPADPVEQYSDLPVTQFAFPGALRDRLVGAVLRGRKVATTSLAIEYQHDHQPLPQVGQRSVVVDSDDRPVAVIEVTGVRVVPLGNVDLSHAVDEGEGHATVDEWLVDHRAFWHGSEVRAELGASFTVDDSTLVVLERFTLVERLG